VLIFVKPRDGSAEPRRRSGGNAESGGRYAEPQEAGASTRGLVTKKGQTRDRLSNRACGSSWIPHTPENAPLQDESFSAVATV
jgi:hypothetical protein